MLRCSSRFPTPNLRRDSPWDLRVGNLGIDTLQAPTAATRACFTRVRGARCSFRAWRTPFQIAPASPADRTRTWWSTLQPRFVSNATVTTNSRPRSGRGGRIISGDGSSCPCRLQLLQNSQYVRLLQARQVQHCRPQVVHFDFGVVVVGMFGSSMKGEEATRRRISRPGRLPLSPLKIKRGRGRAAGSTRARLDRACARVPPVVPTPS